MDVAPTAARLLALEMRNTDGRVLTEVLDVAALAEAAPRKMRPPIGYRGPWLGPSASSAGIK